MDELDVQRKARAFVKSVDMSNIHSDLSVYVTKANARLRFEPLNPGEAAFTMKKPDGSYAITVNANESVERQRFSICHEISHIVLGLPSNHEQVPSWVYPKRDLNEITCDVFAVELLLPRDLWLQAAPPDEPTTDAISELAASFQVSFPVAASRYAALAAMPCVFVTMHGNTVRRAAGNASFRKLGARIRERSPIPQGSVAHKLRSSHSGGIETRGVNQDIWIDDWDGDGELTEIARHNAQFDVTTSLLWFHEDDARPAEEDRFGARVEEYELLEELTGELKWKR